MGMKSLFGLCLIVAVLATAEDIWRRRVSNYVTAGAFLSGVALHGWLYGWTGVWASLLGGVGGFLAFLIFFVLGGMGGGDVKLMAGFGTIVGKEHIVLAIVLVAMLGGLMAVGYLAFRKVRDLARRDEGGSEGKPGRKAMIPYAPAISLGMLLTFVPDLL
jgi:prepilin peptidase CpaA